MIDGIKLEVNNLLCKKEVSFSKEEIAKLVQVAVQNGLIDITYYSKFTHQDSQSTADADTDIIIKNDECTIYLNDGARILIAPKEDEE